MDHLTSLQRSENMRLIRSKNTSPEMLVRKCAHRLGYRFRLHRKDLPGSPDLVFASRSAVVFVNGCYWHRHKNCKLASNPKSNTEYWTHKFKSNVARDNKVYRELRKLGWKVNIIWECRCKDPHYLVNVLKKLLK